MLAQVDLQNQVWLGSDGLQDQVRFLCGCGYSAASLAGLLGAAEVTLSQRCFEEASHGQAYLISIAVWMSEAILNRTCHVYECVNHLYSLASKLSQHVYMDYKHCHTHECWYQGQPSELSSSHIIACTSSIYVVWITWPCNGDKHQCTSHRYPGGLCAPVHKLL